MDAVKRRRRSRRAWLALVCAAPLLLEGAYRAALRASYWRSDAFELYAVGESTTAGEPYPARLAFPSLAASLLGESIDGRPIRVQNLARAGDTLYPQAVNAAKRLRFRRRSNPAALFIYSGHNERFSASREPGPVYEAYLAFKNRVLYRSFFLSDLLVASERIFQARGPRTLVDYERHMRRLIEFSKDSQVLPVLSTVVSNHSGVEPTVLCPEAEIFVATAPCRAALAVFAAAELDALAGRWDDAARGYQRALDEDPGNGFGRATSEQNALLRRLAREYAIPLVDAEALFARASPHGIVGNELMSDGHHPNMKGELILARAFADALTEPVKNPLDTPEQVYARFSFGGIDRAAALIYSGRWLLTTSVRHPAPARRMELARRHFEAAAALTPDDERVGLGLALAKAGDKALFDPEVISVIDRMGRADGRERILSADERRALDLKLRIH